MTTPTLLRSLEQQSGLLVAVVEGLSMRPTLSPGKRVAIDPKRLPVVGDIAAFRRAADGLVLLHRVRRFDGKMWTTRGDACRLDDAPFGREELLGTMVAMYRDHAATWFRPLLPRSVALALALPHAGLRVRCLKLLRKRLWRPMTLKIKPKTDAMDAPPWIEQRLGDDWGVLDARGGELHVLNEVAHAIWKSACEGTNDAVIVEQLVATYDIGADEAARDVAQTLATLRAKGLLPPT